MQGQVIPKAWQPGNSLSSRAPPLGRSTIFQPPPSPKLETKDQIREPVEGLSDPTVTTSCLIPRFDKTQNSVPQNSLNQQH